MILEAKKLRVYRKKLTCAINQLRSIYPNKVTFFVQMYLSMLAEGGIGIRLDVAEDVINEDVAYEAKEALDFLNAREKFWDQLELGSQNEQKGRKKDTKAVGSLRWLM